MSVVLSGDSAAGVSVSVCVPVPPTGKVTEGAQPTRVKPVVVVAASAALAATLPTLACHRRRRRRARAWSLTWTGLLVIVTASIAGIVNDTVTVCVIAGFVALVAVTGERKVVSPAAGMGCRRSGCR